MPANCVPASWRSALATRRHNESLARAQAGATHCVVKVQKNGKRPRQADHSGQTLFSEAKAIEFCARLAGYNPSMHFEVEAI